MKKLISFLSLAFLLSSGVLASQALADTSPIQDITHILQQKKSYGIGAGFDPNLSNDELNLVQNNLTSSIEPDGIHFDTLSCPAGYVLGYSNGRPTAVCSRWTDTLVVVPYTSVVSVCTGSKFFNYHSVQIHFSSDVKNYIGLIVEKISDDEANQIAQDFSDVIGQPVGKCPKADKL